MTNLPPDGGFQKFQSEGLDERTFAVALHSAGYTTSMLGKYLNGYGDPLNHDTAPSRPAGRTGTSATAPGTANSTTSSTTTARSTTTQGRDKYGVDVLNADAQSFIKRSAGKPFAIEVATFAPHPPYTPAPRNANDFPGSRSRATLVQHQQRQPARVARPADGRWDRSRSRRSTRSIRKRAQAVEAVDKLVADTEATLAAEHLTDNTYIVFSSDNGYHLGQHRLGRGKQTAFDTDIRVPLIVAGPGVPAGPGRVAGGAERRPVPDLPATGGRHARRADRGAQPRAASSSRGEHRRRGELSRSSSTTARTTTRRTRISKAEAVTRRRTRRSESRPRHLAGFTGPVEAVYVEYQDRAHETEYYDIDRDPFERVNIARALTATKMTELHMILSGLERCHTATTCWAAGSPP